MRRDKKKSEIAIHQLIGPLHLAVGLWMVDEREAVGHLDEVVEGFPEFGSKSRLSVRETAATHLVSATKESHRETVDKGGNSGHRFYRR